MSSVSGEYNGAGMHPLAFRAMLRKRMRHTKQRAKLKRLHDLNRIQDMKSNEGNHPLETFPEELWRIILDMLDAKDRGNMWKIHDIFQGIMENSHPGDNLFPQILNVLKEHFVEDQDESLSFRQSNDLIPLANYLDLRRVSKSLRNEINSLIEQDLLIRLRESASTSEPKYKAYFEFHEFSRQEISRLDECIAFTSSNPKSLISRSIKLRFVLNDLTDPQIVRRFNRTQTKIANLLRNTGDHILHLQVGAFYDVNPGENGRDRLTKMYLALIKWLGFLPHLKWLQFFFCCGGLRSCTDCLDTQLVRRKRPPRISSLERFDFTMTVASVCDRNCVAICKEIIKANPQITNFHLSRGGESSSLFTRIGSLHLDTLEIGERNMHSPFSLAKIQSVLNPEWTLTLKQLILRITLENASVGALLRFLQKYGNLEKLTLQIRDVYIGRNIGFLRLPNLKEFEMDMTSVSRREYDISIHFFFSLQFLVYNKNLKKLHWEHEERSQIEIKRLKRFLKGNTRPRNMIDFQGGFGNLNESNLWKVFPCLEDLTVNIRDLKDPTRPVVKYQRRRKF